jgi:hypothetical protein
VFNSFDSSIKYEKFRNISLKILNRTLRYVYLSSQQNKINDLICDYSVTTTEATTYKIRHNQSSKLRLALTFIAVGSLRRCILSFVVRRTLENTIIMHPSALKNARAPQQTDLNQLETDHPSVLLPHSICVFCYSFPK